MAVKVIVPNKHYNGVYHGVEFKDGVGIFEDEALAKSIAKTLGYEVEPVGDKPKAEAKKAPAKKAAPKKKAE